MMNLSERYHSRLVTAEEAVRQIHSGNRIFLTGNCSVPQKTLAALVNYAPQLENVEICQSLTVGPADYVSPEMQGHLHVNELLRWRDTTFINGGAICGSWWRGSRHGTEEGFGLVTLRDNRVEWEYVDYGWQARRAANE